MNPERANRFGRFLILKKLGQGGMGTVYLAYDAKLDRMVALKIPTLSPSPTKNLETLARFRREARVAAGFRHPNFCPMYEAGEADNRLYLAMAYIEGETLASFVDADDPMDLLEVAKLICMLATAMTEVHDRGVLHRDLKPSNVVIDKQGTPIILDFGLAHREGTDDQELTTVGSIIGTIAYMSPEQIRGDLSKIGPASDVYSLGVMLYELATGRRPFQGPPPAIMAQALLNAPVPPSTIRPGFSPILEWICLKAMAKDVSCRYPSMRDFAGDLDLFVATTTVPTQQMPKPAQTNWMRFLAMMGTIAVVVLSVAIATVVRHRASVPGSVRIEGLDASMHILIDGREVANPWPNQPVFVPPGHHSLMVIENDRVVSPPILFSVARGTQTEVRLGPLRIPNTSSPIEPRADSLVTNVARQDSHRKRSSKNSLDESRLGAATKRISPVLPWPSRTAEH